MFKNVAAKFMVFAFDATTNVPKTGDAAQITAYVSKDYGTVTVLGDTSATEMDATNAPGYYLFDAAQAETNADCLMVSGKSSTSNIKVIGAPAVIYTRPTTGWLAPTTAARTLTVDASGRALADVDTIKTNPVVNGGTITFPTTATLASTTNITAGTIATVTTLTNLPAIPANWLTAAGTAADFGAELADAVWDEALSGHAVSGSAGEALSNDANVYGPTILSAVQSIDTRVPAALVGGRMDSSVGAMAANVLTAAAAAADFGAEVADAVLNRDMSTGTDSGSTTVRTPRQALRALRNKVSVSGGTLTVTKEDDATSSWTAAVTTDAAADPITAVDPAGP